MSLGKVVAFGVLKSKKGFRHEAACSLSIGGKYPLRIGIAPYFALAHRDIQGSAGGDSSWEVTSWLVQPPDREWESFLEN